MEGKKAKLESLLWEYCKYTRWEKVNAYYVNGDVHIVWSKIKVKGDDVYLDFTMRRFPVDDIDKRIKKYQDKIRYEKELKNKELIES